MTKEMTSSFYLSAGEFAGDLRHVIALERCAVELVFAGHAFSSSPGDEGKESSSESEILFGIFGWTLFR